MIFVDTNVLMYAVGRSHPLQEEAREFFSTSLISKQHLVTSAEVLQELLHAYLTVQRIATLDAALRLAQARMASIWALEPEDVRLAMPELPELPAYNPGNRRDPFESLLVSTEARKLGGRRPEGIPGLLIDEIDLRGIWRTGKGYVVQVGVDNQIKSYLLKAGDQLYDGNVVSVTRSEVVFKQIVQDPTALKPFREVVKTLNPS